jgi:hypothetical protein
MENDTCELKIGDEWAPLRVDAALGINSERVKRCPECHGRVRAHKASVDGMRAHFEHFEAHAGCSRSRSVPFIGISTIHPKAIS